MNNLILFLTLLVAGISCANGYVYCYYCSNCPIPFDPNSPYVTRVTSDNNFCAKKSYSSDASAPNSRGAADPGLCVVTGCRWIYDSTGRQIYQLIHEYDETKDDPRQLFVIDHNNENFGEVLQGRNYDYVGGEQQWTAAQQILK